MRSLSILIVAVAMVGAALSLIQGLAFPPAPHHLFMGTVRDEFGDPVTAEDALVVMETSSGYRLTAPVEPDVVPGVNFRLQVAMDAGITRELYRPSAMSEAMPFQMWVEIGGVSYRPIEMVGDFAAMGSPGETTTLDLTLGIDLDGDGLPDAWEEELLAALGLAGGLEAIRAEDDLDGDGLSNLAEYLSGNYAFDGNDGLFITQVALSDGTAFLEWLAIRGRSYGISASADMETWQRVDFRLLDDADTTVRERYYANDVDYIQVAVVPEEDVAPYRFFRVVMDLALAN